MGSVMLFTIKKSSSYFNLPLILSFYNCFQQISFSGFCSIFIDLIDKEDVAMLCHRCNGAMVYEKFYSEGGDYFGWRCVICGEIIDQVILKNRYQQN